MTGERYIYGLDPASKLDYFGIVIHQLPLGRQPIPRLVELQAITHTSYLAVFDRLTKDLFRKYPPYFIVIDYNTEKTISEVLQRDYGKNRIEMMSFGNETKNQLKDDGLAILKQGYEFPEPMLQKNQQQRKLVTELIEQLKREQMLFTRSGKLTFDHPTGQHNDLAVAWELSVHGCLKFMINVKADGIAVSMNRERRSGWGIPDEVDDPFAEIRLNPANQIEDSYTWSPS